MPQEHKIVNGRLVLTGAQQSSDLVPVARQPAARPKPPKPSGGAKPKPKGFFEKLSNDIRYELFNRPRPANPFQRYAGGLSRAVASSPLQGIALGVAGAGDNAMRAGYSYAQRATGRPKADASAGRFGGHLDQTVDQVYKALGAKPPSAMTQDERGGDAFRRSVALNLILSRATPGFGFAGATTALGGAVRGGAAFAVNEALSTFLDDNTGSNIVNLINQSTGLKLPGGVDVGKDDMLDSAVKSLIPNAAAGVAVGAAVGGAISLGAAAFRNIRRNTRATRAVQQEVRQRAKQESMGLLEKDEADGLNFTPQAMETPAPAPREPSFQEANAAMEERLGMNPKTTQPEPTPAPEPAPKPIPSAELQDPTSPGADMGAIYEPRQERPWDYDPELPESTALGKGIEELSDSELQIVLNSPGAPVVERVNQTLEARAQIEPPAPIDAGMVLAPADRLADDYLPTVMRKLGGREDYELRPLFDPDTNPALWQRAQALTGVDDPSQLSKADMLDAFGAMAADGQVPIVNRMMGGQMLPTGEITAAPQVFQYKEGVNAAGEQIGNSLEGVERWDPNAENIIQVWRDASGEIGDPGRVYVVNGHNRLAAASRMGIPSMRVEYLDAPTAAEARLQGAISNVSDGKGTVFDAAKLAREYGIGDPAQLKALGKPGASGFWKDGIAIGRLPEDVFTAAVNEQIPLRRAVIIGESGVDEETMRSAYRYLVQQGPDNVKETTLREMLAMAKHSPATSSVDQPDILTGTEWAQNFNAGMLAKADLAGAVRLLLSKEKKLFGTVGSQAGQIKRVGQVDAGAAKDISGEASRALAIFDDLKYQTGPVADLLNEGTQRVLAGEQAAQVAKGIKNRLAAAIQEAMGKEVAPATDVVQEDIFAAAGRQADETPQPVELTPEQRDAAEARLLQEAIAGGEVRPPNAPIPELPAPAQVRLDELDPNEPITPGSKAAQAFADETRLALEHARADAALQEVQERALKDANDYELLTFDQKKDAGLTAGLDKAITPEVLPPEGGASIADLFAEQARQLAQSDARLYRRTGEAIANIRQGLDELAPAPVRPEPIRLVQPASQPELLLPQDLRKASPRYGRNTITFQSDLDRAAYVLANDAVKPSKSAAKFRQVVQEAGLDLKDVVAHGQKVKAALKQAAKGNPGQIELPAQLWRERGSGGAQRMAQRGDLLAQAAALRAELYPKDRIPELISEWRKVVGDEVRIRVLDTYKIELQSEQWGGDGSQLADIAGVYEQWKDTMTIWQKLSPIGDIPVRMTFSDLLHNGFHESFHRIVRMAMPSKDMAVLNTPMARFKAAMAMDEMGAERSTIAYDELLTEAAAKVFVARSRNMDPVSAILDGFFKTNDPGKAIPTGARNAITQIAGALNKVYDFIEKTVNLFQGRGFESISTVFEKAARGEMRAADPKLGVRRVPNKVEPVFTHGLNHAFKVGIWEDFSWNGKPVAALPKELEMQLSDIRAQQFFDAPPPAKLSLASQQRVQRQIQDIDQQITDNRRKAEQEGC